MRKISLAPPAYITILTCNLLARAHIVYKTVAACTYTTTNFTLNIL